MKKIMKKLCFIFMFIALTSAKEGYVDLPCKNDLELSKQITNPWHRISSILNVLFVEYSTAGINSETFALTTTVNESIIAPEALYFSDAIIPMGIEPSIALNMSNQLVFYALAAENYAMVINSGGDIATALAVLNAQKKNLITALKSNPQLKAKKITSFVNQYQKYEILSIQAFANGDFSQAIAEHEQAQNFADALSAYIAKRILQTHYLGKCR